MTLPIIVGRTAVGGTLYAAITATPPAPGSPPRRGIVAHSAEIAMLAPFASVDEAVAEIERLGRGTGSEDTTP